LLIEFNKESTTNSSGTTHSSKNEPSEPSDLAEKISGLQDVFPYLSAEVLKLALKDNNYNQEQTANELFDPSNVEKFERQAARK